MKWQANYKKFGWQSIKQDLTAVIRLPSLASCTSTMYLISDSVLWWHAQFLHKTQYQCVNLLHAMHVPLPPGPFNDLSMSLTLKTGFPGQCLNLFTISWFIFESFFRRCKWLCLGEWQVCLVIHCTSWLSIPKFGKLASFAGASLTCEFLIVWRNILEIVNLAPIRLTSYEIHLC